MTSSDDFRAAQDRLIERVWGDAAPQGVRTTLYSYVHHLRRTGVPIARRSGGYLLAADPLSIDLHLFDHLVSRARTEREASARLLDSALSLWRGEPFEGMDSSWAVSLRGDLQRRRRAAEHERNDVALAGGRHREILPELVTAVAAHPLDERLAYQYILAAYRCDMRAEALARFAQLRGTLAEDLGVDPGPDLRELHHRILNADPTLALSPTRGRPVPRQLPAPPPLFTGRTKELALLDRALLGDHGAANPPAGDDFARSIALAGRTRRPGGGRRVPPPMRRPGDARNPLCSASDVSTKGRRTVTGPGGVIGYEDSGGVDRDRVTEVIVTTTGGRRARGTGYRVAAGAVLTAAHVVADAAEVVVRLNARRGDEWVAAAEVVFLAPLPAVDLAVLAVEPRPGEPSVPPVTFGRVPEADVVLPVSAVGFPRFKLRRPSDLVRDADVTALTYRDSHHLTGTVAALSNLKQGTLEITTQPPDRDPDPARSPWEGMSGAAVFSGAHLVGVVSEHHRSDGLNRVTATRVDGWPRHLDQGQLAELGRHFPSTGAAPVNVPGRLRRRSGVAVPPGVPATYVDRPGERLPVVDALLTGDRTQMTIVGLAGMPGAGKSVLARAVAADERVVAHFGDRVLWLDVGPVPDLTRLQARLAEAFGDSRPITDVDQGVDALRDLARGGPCLIVLDNVWRSGDLRAFDLRHPDVTLLVTTRSRATLFAGDAVFDVGAVDRATSRQVLARYAGVRASNLPAAADRVAALCGNLVLALAIAGGMVAEGRDWEQVLHRLRRADLDKLAAALRDYPYDSLLRAIEASVADLSAEQRARFLDLAVFEDHAAIPPVAAEVLWGLSGMDAVDVADLLLFLDRRSLVQRDRQRGTFALHDMISVYLRSQADPAATRALHDRLADSFLEQWGGLDAHLPGLRASHPSPAEHYAVGHLVAHLDAAGRFADVDRLLSVEWDDGTGRVANAWFTAHERLGLMAAYQSDVRRAWRHAAAGDPDLASELRFALMAGSIASITANLPPDLVVSLVQAALWSPHQALAVVEVMPDDVVKAECLAALVPLLPADLAPEVDAVAATLGAQDRAVVLGRLVATRGDGAEELVAAVHAITDPFTRVRVAGGFAALLPELLDVALAAADEVGEPSARAAALAEVAREVGDPHVVDLAWSLAQTAEQDPYWQARGMVDLVPLLDPARLAEALRIASANPDPAGRAQALVAVASRVRDGDGWFGGCLDAIRAVRNDPYLQAGLYAALAEHLPPELFPDLLDAAGAMTDPSARAHALADVLPHAPVALRPALCRSVLGLVGQMDRNAAGQVEVMTAVAPFLPPTDRAEVLSGALATAALIADPATQARAFDGLAPLLTDDLVEEAAVAASTVNDPFVQAQFLTALAASAPPPRARHLLLEALVVVRAVRCEPWLGPVARTAFASALPDEERGAVTRSALASVRGLGNHAMREHALSVVEQFLPDDLRDGPPQAGAQAGPPAPDHDVEAIRRAVRAGDRPAALVTIIDLLAPHLDAQERAWAHDGVTYNDTASWIAVLAGVVAPRLSEEDFGALLDAFQVLLDDIVTADVQLDLLVELAVAFPGTDAAEVALDVLPEVSAPARQASALSRLAPVLPPHLRARALTAVRALADPNAARDALASLVPYLTAEHLNDAVDAAAGVDLLDGRALVLADVAVSARRLGVPRPERYWRAALESAAPAGRELVLEVAVGLTAAFVDAGTARRALVAVEDVERWWPAGASGLHWLGDRDRDAVLPATVPAAAPVTGGRVFIPGLLDGDPVTEWDHRCRAAREAFTERLLANYASRRHVPISTKVEVLPARLWSSSLTALDALRTTASDKWYDGRYVQAVDELTMLLNAYPNEPDWQNFRGQILGDLGYAALALVDLDMAIALSPRGEVAAYAVSARGYAYGALGRLEQAFRDFEESLKMAPENAWTFFRRGLVRFAHGLDAEADLRASLVMSQPPLNDLQRGKARWMVREHFGR